jgi:protein Tex
MPKGTGTNSLAGSARVATVNSEQDAMQASVMVPVPESMAPVQPVPKAKPQPRPPDFSRIAQDLQIRKLQVESVVQLLDEGNTVPFITRYRKERTGGLDEEIIRQIQVRVAYLRHLADRKQTILKSIDNQGKLTESLRSDILAADTAKRLEDLYLPYKPKKRTLATTARERGLEPLALAIWSRDPAVANLNEVLPAMVDPAKELTSVDDVLAGVGHILAEQIAETAEIRAAVRSVLWETGKLCTQKNTNLTEGQGLDFKDYFQFSESARRIPPHRILAINRGEKANAVQVRLEADNVRIHGVTFEKLPLADHPHAEILKKAAEDALIRLLLPSLEREIRRELTEEAEDHAVRVFARNLKSLLLQPPLHGRRVLAIDPGFRTGCKVAVLDELGNPLEDAVVCPFARPEKSKPKSSAPKIQPPKDAAGGPAVVSESATPAQDAPPADATPARPEIGQSVAAVQSDSPPSESAPNQPSVDAVSTPLTAATATETELAKQNQPEPAPAAQSAAAEETVAPPGPSPRQLAKEKLEELVRKHAVNLIAIGNGTACRETEEIISQLISEKLPDLAYVVVNEAGASVYSASAIGREEFPNFDATLRGTISIGRRLQDPLSELIKIDPQNIGVGLYQHDIHPRRLKDSLEAVIESCVNYVGVDLNTASVPLLRHVSGLNQLVARELVEYRQRHGPFRSREQISQVPSVGPARFVQAAGFLKIDGGDNPLDQTWIHPESYEVATRLLAELGTATETLRDPTQTKELRKKIQDKSVAELSQRLNVGMPTLQDIFDALEKPGRDPREDLPPPIFKKGILKLEDLHQGMELKGTVLNVVDFGAFVDIGLKDSGLVHISQMANRYIKNPYELVAVGDVVNVWVLAVDHGRKRVSLTMIKPGTERKPPENKPAQTLSPENAAALRDRRQPPPRRSGAQQHAGQRMSRPQAVQAERSGASAPPQQSAAATGQPHGPASRPRKPHRQPPKPKLSQAALEGATPLRTFGELKAYFEAQKPAPPRPAPDQETPVPPPS